MSLSPSLHVPLIDNKAVYFISDVHLGLSYKKYSSKKREQLLIDWLNKVENKTSAIFILGDLFDFWFEYKTVVPKGFVRLLGKLASLSDKGIPLYFFIGNHDLWMKDYFTQELGIPVFHEPQYVNIGKKYFLLGHGDGLGPSDNGYKFMKGIFKNPFFQRAFQSLHPDLGITLGAYLSERKKNKSGKLDFKFKNEDQEWLVQYAKSVLNKNPETKYDFFVFGHRHLPMQVKLNDNNATYINLGEWVTQFTYACFDGQELQLLEHPTDTQVAPVQEYIKRYENF